MQTIPAYLPTCHTMGWLHRGNRLSLVGLVVQGDVASRVVGVAVVEAITECVILVVIITTGGKKACLLGIHNSPL